MTFLIPIIIIGGIFVVFYMNKDKFMAKAMASNNEIMERWNDKDAVIEDFFADDNKFGLLQKKLGEKKIESMCWGRPPKNVVGTGLKKGVELAMGYETFDMDAYYLVIAGGELHFLHSNGAQVVEHESFPLVDMQDVKIAYDSSAMKAAKYILSDDGNLKTFKLTFKLEDESYSFLCQETLDSFAKFKVEKQITVNRKMGQNPFSRINEGMTRTDISLLYMYAAESLEKFKNTLQPEQPQA